jgi:hypothetical protein
VLASCKWPRTASEAQLSACGTPQAEISTCAHCMGAHKHKVGWRVSREPAQTALKQSIVDFVACYKSILAPAANAWVATCTASFKTFLWHATTPDEHRLDLNILNDGVARQHHQTMCWSRANSLAQPLKLSLRLLFCIRREACLLFCYLATELRFHCAQLLAFCLAVTCGLLPIEPMYCHRAVQAA